MSGENRHARGGPAAALAFLLVALGACSDDPVRPPAASRVPSLVASPALIGAPYVFTVTTRQVTTNLSAQLDPSISGDIVVYTDFRNSNPDISFTNLATFAEGAVTTAAGAQQLHDVSGQVIVYTDAGVIPVRVLSYDVGTGLSTPLAPTTYPQREPTTDGRKVAFEVYLAGPATNGDVGLVDLSTGSYSVLTATPEHEGRPVIAGDLIAFERGAAPLALASDIVVYDLVAGTEVVVGTGLEPHTDGRRVAWSTGGNDTPTADIVVRDMTTGTTHTIALPGAQVRPRVSGDFLAFDDWGPGPPDVVVYHLPSGAMHRFGSIGAEFLNDLDGSRVAYTSNQTGNLDIFVADFSVVFGEIAVAPASVNFGDVPVGNSATQIVTITNAGAADLSISAVGLAPGAAASFTVQSVTPAVPVTIGPGDVVDVEIRFTPTVNGPVTGTLRIQSDDVGEPVVDVPQAGAGTADRTLAQQVEELLAFFDAAVTGGTLVGDGAGASAPKRLDALRNMLVAAGGMIADGDTAEACTQLGDARDRTDGQPQPPDFVAGPSAVELYQRITSLMTILGCS